MAVRVKFNHLPAIIQALEIEGSAGVHEAADTFEAQLVPKLWVDTGILRSTTRQMMPKRFGTTVAVGHWAGRGFIAGFLEWGTVKMAPQPVVTPAAHAFEPEFGAIMTKAIQRAVRAT